MAAMFWVGGKISRDVLHRATGTIVVSPAQARWKARENYETF